MNLSDRLRAEARSVPSTAGPDLIARVTTAVRADRAPRSVIRFERPSPLPWLAAAAVLAIAVGLAVAGARTDAMPAPIAAIPAPARVAAPAPPSWDEILASVPQAGPLSGELAALRTDLASVVATVRGVAPF